MKVLRFQRARGEGPIALHPPHIVCVEPGFGKPNEEATAIIHMLGGLSYTVTENYEYVVGIWTDALEEEPR
jgi:hypothetical protein